MKEKFKLYSPYVMVAIATFVAIAIFLYANHQKMRSNQRMFNRNVVSLQLYKGIESRIVHKEIIEEDSCISKFKNIIASARIDSTHSYVFIIEPDTLSMNPTGIYVYNNNTGKVDLDSCLSRLYIPGDYEVMAQKKLAYDCTFSVSPEQMTITFLHLSDIYVFNKDGKILYKMRTYENVPPPSVIKYRDYYIFERGKAFNTNIASFLYEQNLYVFSLRETSQFNKYLVDCYNVKTNDYLYSFTIDNAAGEDNQKIESVTVNSDTITIESTKCVTKIKMR